ncbi:MAG: class-II fumarase/aspartase family protein, partial [Rhodospirillales bacterium]
MATNPADGTVLGTLYGSDAMRAVFAERQWLQYMLDVEVALARAQARLGIVPDSAARAIAAAARANKFDLKELAAGTRVTGYPVVALIRGLARAAGPRAGGYVHWGATTQDIMDTALVLQIRAGLAIIERGVARVGRALTARAVKHRRDVMAGRTHLQHALPVTFGYKCAVWAAPLIADAERLKALRVRVLNVQFAGAAGTLASLGKDGRAVTEGLARELALAVPDAPWHVARGALAETAAVLGIVSGNLAKFAADIALLMQTEVGEIFEPHTPGRGGSSTMPQKRNPIASEYVLAAARGVHALAPLMLGAMAQDHERGTGPWQAEALALPQIFVLTGGALEHAAAIAEGMTVDIARMRRNLDLTHGLIMAEAVMMALAPRIGRDAAHDAVEHACARALDQGVTLAEALGREPALKGKLDTRSLTLLTVHKTYLVEDAAVVSRVA